ncbi:AfsR/SARP family transcriptional regulator [Saccharothrix algeriensis]|uniref:DNA-binding SARP family transcriptional activator n=2 Tax=Saccharothrix algeriensis TaxID=173560 RepID=A0ABS2S3H3_9PSEU|nr:BTAD domain-containing putative transcriptional regulator [Saccharothrix algeriensis]MBM7810469.1 DNA-binding SARP family transcriptional activator [Saccharothrix algeriensis]
MTAEFRVLGPLEVLASGERVRIEGPRQQKLLALLLLQPGRVVPVDRLVDELWSEPPASVRQQVHNAVGALRRSLGAEGGGVRLVRTEFGYRLDIPDDAVDTYHFVTAVQDAKQAEELGHLPKAVELLRSALAVWRGDAFAGLSGSAIESAAANLNEQRLLCLEELFALRLRAGESASLVGELTQLVAEHPLRESLRGSLMLTLHRSGRQPDALAAYAEGKRLLADELGLDPGQRLREIHAAILSGAADSVAPPVDEVERAAARPEPTRSYLPHDTTSFSGRSAELVELVEGTRNALPTALVISAIDGMGGVGKTTLAIHLAHHIADEYPDGQYFIDLRGFSPGMDPVTPEQALDALLLDSGVPPELVPVDLERRSALWRSRMAGQRALLVLDNAADAAQVTPLLPGTAGVLVVVTSRRKLTALEGAVPLSLDVMTREDGVSLFTTVVGAHRAGSEPDAVDTVVELCGRLPLAIRIAAARLRDRSSWTVADLMDRLRTQRQRSLFLRAGGQSVMAVLRVSYRYLAPSQQRLFRLLSLHPGTDFDAYTAAALGGVDVEEAVDVLESLYDDNLLKQNVAGRYYFHDLIGDCAGQLLAEAAEEQEERAAVHRLLDYYLQVAHTWCGLLDPGIYRNAPRVDHVLGEIREVDSYKGAVDALNAEFANLTAAALFAAQRGWHRHAWQLVCTLHPFLKLRNFGGKAYDLYKSAAEAARAAGDEFGESISLQGLSGACREQRTVTEAVEHLNRALELMRRVGDVDREAHQTVDLGNLMFRADRLPQARDLYLAADRLLAGSTDTRLRSAVVNNLGVLCRDLGEFDLALDHLRRALEMPGHSSRDRLITEGVLGTALHLRGDHQAALHAFGQVLDEATADRFAYGEAMALMGMSSVYRHLGDLMASVEHGRRALRSAREFGFREFECEALSCLGEAFFLLADTERAQQVFVEVGQMGERYQSIRYQARALEGLAHLSFARGEVEGARRYWEKAVETYPAGLVDIRYARTHLTSPGNGWTTCFRCETA